MAGIFDKIVDAINSEGFNNWVSGKSTPKVGLDTTVGFDVSSIIKIGLTAISCIVFAVLFHYFLERYPKITIIVGALILLITGVYLSQSDKPVKEKA